jgi:hypothetical protein
MKHEYYFWLHTNGRIFEANVHEVASNPDYFKKPEVVRVWHVDSAQKAAEVLHEMASSNVDEKQLQWVKSKTTVLNESAAQLLHD